VGSSVVDLGPRLAVVLAVLTALAAAAGRLSGLGQDRAVLAAALRATVQLAVVSAVLVPVVAADWPFSAFAEVPKSLRMLSPKMVTTPMLPIAINATMMMYSVMP